MNRSIFERGFFFVSPFTLPASASVDLDAVGDHNDQIKIEPKQKSSSLRRMLARKGRI